MLSKLRELQSSLEDYYGAATKLNVCDFIRFEKQLERPAYLKIKQDSTTCDLELAILLDRDIFSASDCDTSKHWRILAEEVSHFVYLAFNHNRGRNVTVFEMELQSEIDRVVLASRKSHSPLTCDQVLFDLFHNLYRDPSFAYEESRKLAAKLIWNIMQNKQSIVGRENDKIIREFFHSDLPQKLHILSQLPYHNL